MMGSKSSKSSASADVVETEVIAFNETISNHTQLVDRTVLCSSGGISETDFGSCFELIALTSADAYQRSSKGWSPSDKRAEMRQSAMRYILVREHQAEVNYGEQINIIGFLSYMLTEEDDYSVVYIYELHILPAWRGKGIGSSLVEVVEAVGASMRMEKAMLTVFTSNESARALYQRLGYEKWDEEPVVRKRLRSGTKESRPTYIILAKNLDRTAAF